ncbi:MAG: rhodanese-like domain-containing protein [Gammaproteobacteria bacterium]|nr:rhodanese-like domain-containing protein [Gammaproteobacteria bacterium]
MPKNVQDIIAETKEGCHCLNPHDAREFYDTTTGATIIDVREPGEVEKGKLKQSINIPRGLLELKIAELCPSDDVPILLHCGAGGRASLSARALQEMGYSNVHVIDGKFEEIEKAFS